jgi:hypothetical protein
MSNLIRYAFAVALGLGCAGLQGPANGQTTQSKTIRKAPTGNISGRVTIHGKGLAGIVVGLRSGQNEPQQSSLMKGVTDPDGNYRIIEVMAGNYQVVPFAPRTFFRTRLYWGREARASSWPKEKFFRRSEC